MSLQSAIYTGIVRHRRREPDHAFVFPLYMAYLDLTELEQVLNMSRWWSRSRFAPARFCREDYLQHDGLGLADAVRATVAAKLGRMPSGPVRMLTHLRNFGYVFNPVTFYYCFTPDGELDAVVSQITNTPWKERHSYVLDSRTAQRASRVHRWSFDKAFHVSPFMPMDLGYDWSFTTPSGEAGSKLLVHMNLHESAGSQPGPKAFDATLQLTRTELSPSSMRNTVLQYPFMTARVIASIHLHALRLWLKKATVHPHPSNLDAHSSAKAAT